MREGFNLFTQWALLVSRTSRPLSSEESQKIDAEAESLFKRMRDFVTSQAQHVSL